LSLFINLYIVYKKIFLVTASLFLLNVISSKAQGLELGLYLGGSNYFGDLSHNTIAIGETHPSASFIGRVNLGEKWAAKGLLGYARISGTDANASKAENVNRNLSFFSNVYELSIQLEYNLLPNSTRYSATRKFIPYLFGGIGLFNYNPKALYLGQEVELQPIGTEGQGTTQYNDKIKYSLTQFCFPIGFGVKKKISKRLSLGFEIGVRYTRTNYLDDVGGTYADYIVVARSSGAAAGALADRSGELTSDKSNLFKDGDKRSNKSIDINDMYLMGGFTITYIFPNGGIKCPRF